MLTVRLLGPLEVEVAGDDVAVAAPMQRAVLAVLALARGTATKEHLIDALWDDPPANAGNVVQQYVSALRRRLGHEQVVTSASGYSLNLAVDGVDVARFQHLVSEAARRSRAGDLAGSSRLAAQAKALVRGAVLSDMPDVPFVRAWRASLERAVLEAEVHRLAVGNDLGRSAEVLPDAEALASRQPLDEAAAAQLMRALAGVGRRADALEVYTLMRVRLADELGLEPGEQLRSAQAAVLKADSLTVGAGDEDGQRSRLPHPPTPLLGRESEVGALEALLDNPHVRLITMTGPGGVGKTRLALDLAWRVNGTREVLWVRLASIATADVVFPTLAAAVGVKAPSEADLIPRIARMIRGRDLLLFLDNFEHVLEASSALAALLGAADENLQVLVTSREPLRITGEYVYPVGPLSTSAADGEPPPAVALFWERAEAANPRFRRNRELEAVTEICRRLDGLPLAIELAAARTTLLQPTMMIERLASRLSLLSSGTRDAPARQRSLRACLAWSVDLLSEDERRAFTLMSGFAGGATIPSFEAVCREALPNVDPLVMIDSLVAKSLVRPTDDATGRRLWMLETIREYAGELLAGSDVEDAVRLAHARHFHELLAGKPSLLDWPPRTAEQVRAQAAELPNARRALRSLMDFGAAELYADLVVGLAPQLNLHGFRDELDSYVEPLLGVTDVPARRRIDLLYRHGTLLRTRGDFSGATQAFATAVEQLQHHPDAVQEAAVRAMLAELPNHPGGENGRQQELALAREASLRSGDPEVVAMTVISSLGLWADGSDAHLTDAETALETARRVNNEFLQMWALVNLSEEVVSSLDPTDIARAEAWGREAFDIAMRVGDQRWMAIGLCNAAGASLLGGADPHQAAAELRRSLELERRLGNAVQEIELLLRLAAAEHAQGHAELAAVLYSTWQTQSSEHGIEMSPANQRIADTFLRPSDGPPPIQSPPPAASRLTLAESVEVALGERAVPS